MQKAKLLADKLSIPQRSSGHFRCCSMTAVCAGIHFFVSACACLLARGRLLACFFCLLLHQPGNVELQLRVLRQGNDRPRSDPKST